MASAYENIILYIDEHIKDEITLDDISKAVGYSSHHIYKIFKMYTSVPVMEYIRRKKLYSAANEFYTGRKLYDIALDYGYETQAGFYKAFQSVFGCSPSEYKNNISERKTFMLIENVKNTKELDYVLAFIRTFYPTIYSEEGSYDYWVKMIDEMPELLLYVKDGDKICGSAFACEGNVGITISHDSILEEYKSQGIHEMLMVEIEKRAKKFGYHLITLGITDGEEAFYANLGYTASLLIQSGAHSIEELENFNKNNKNYEVLWTNLYDGEINQICLRTPIGDKELPQKYKQAFDQCWTQTIVQKNI